jgi:glutamine synthetase
LKDIDIEVSTLLDMARTMVLPAAMEHQLRLALSIEAVARVKGQAPWAQMGLLDACSEEIGRLRERLDGLDQLVKNLVALSEHERAHRYAYEVAPAMQAVRESCDKLEEMVADTLWPLPKYPEMLFMS